ncbi:MAG: ABC transporter permease [Candidatus Nanoarchaeia archaeon]|jgi:putative ABC transport system permease protein
MKANDLISLTIKNITYRKTRSWLTILGIVIGIAAVVGLMGLGDAIQGAINVQLSGLGGDKMVITPGLSQQSFSRSADFSSSGGTATITTQLGNSNPITEHEASQLANIAGVNAVSPMVQRSYEVTFRGEFSTTTVEFVEPNGMYAVEQPEVIDGRWLLTNDKFSCIIGYNIANDVFSNQINAGDMINVKGKSCRVVGVLKKEGGFSGTDNYVIMNLGVVSSFIDDYNDELTYVYVKVSDTEQIEEVEEQITALLLRLHKTTEEDFTILSFASIQESVGSITTLITGFLGGIAAISLLVGAIGISNTMLTSVMERTREIGILKAIGAKKQDVLLLFITEAGIMSLIGGFIGLIVGMGLAQGIIVLLPTLFMMPENAAAGLKLVVNPLLLIGALAISLAIGIISGYLPAKKAAELNPIEAIWYE